MTQIESLHELITSNEYKAEIIMQIVNHINEPGSSFEKSQIKDLKASPWQWQSVIESLKNRGLIRKGDITTVKDRKGQRKHRIYIDSGLFQTFQEWSRHHSIEDYLPQEEEETENSSESETEIPKPFIRDLRGGVKRVWRSSA